jgi:hypothetical protein
MTSIPSKNLAGEGKKPPGFVVESCGVNNENSRVLTKPWGFD